MPKRSTGGHITGGVAFALIPLVVPVILLLKLFGIGRYVNRSADEVAGFIRDFIDNTGGDWDWDDFTSVPIKDARLEAIRDEACQVGLPVSESGFGELKKLLWKAEALSRVPEE